VAQDRVDELDGGLRAEPAVAKVFSTGARTGAGWRRCGRGGGGAPAWRGVAAAGSTSTRPGPDRRPGRRAATAPGSRRCRLGWWLWRRGSGRRLEWGRGWWRRRSSVSVWRTRCPKRRRCWGPRTTTGRGPPACSRCQVCRGLRPPVHRSGALPSASAQAWRFPGWWRWCRGWSGATPGRSGRGRAGAARRAAAGGGRPRRCPGTGLRRRAGLRDLAEGVPGLDGVGVPVPGCCAAGWVRCQAGQGQDGAGVDDPVGPVRAGLRSASSRQRCPSPSSVAAIDHSDSPAGHGVGAGGVDALAGGVLVT
jgi:hypothetical protein